MHSNTNTSAQTVDLPPPADVGMPDKFKSWRPRQAEAIYRAAESDKRFVVICAPTGSGKSLTYMAAAHLTGMRTAVLTSTKGLQNQLLTDFESIGLVDMRGRGNYPCKFLVEEDKLAVLKPAGGGGGADVPMCDIGPCMGGMECAHRGGGCDYYGALAVAYLSKLVITNYAYWLHSDAQTGAKSGLGDFDILVLDEAHNAPEDLGSHLSVMVTHNQIQRLLGIEWPLDHDNWDRWKEWAADVSSLAGERAEALKDRMKRGRAKRSELKDYKELSRMEGNLERVSKSKAEWVQHMARRGDRGHLTIQFDPVWPGEFAEGILFRGIKKIIMTSATVRPKTLDLLGVPSRDVDFVEYPSTFPVANRPVLWSPTIRVDNRAGSDLMRVWVTKIDNIIRGRLDRKGIIHTVSYARRDFILRHSEFAGRMVVHETATARDVVARFKSMPPSSGAVLVSPSMSTGWDFPDDDCRYQIIGKVPFPDSRDKIVKARSAQDPEYSYYVAMQSLQQAAGRGNRSAGDLCENFIIDDHIGWFLSKWGGKMASRWFMESYKKVSGIPVAPHIDKKERKA